MMKYFCDECGEEIRSCDTGSAIFGCSPTINRAAATKYSVRVAIYPVDGGTMAAVCQPCKQKIISEMVNRSEATTRS